MLKRPSRSQERACPSCGTAADAGWQHCGSCGTALPVRRRAWDRIDTRSPVVLLAVAVFALLLGGVALAGSERRLANERSELDRAQASLRESRELVTALRVELTTRVVERDAARTELDKTKGSLSDAQRSVESQQKQLDTIKACLTAIADIGIALDEGDERAANEAVDRAERHCSEAQAFL
ncbi:MAG TPA: zinc ribbon domain-containing protein [Acidimicrobiales bacterium]|nr:zinc ribbon domain-containing protein [Acidimicrobiales bacterium]